jgi:hypothetical protein
MGWRLAGRVGFGGVVRDAGDGRREVVWVWVLCIRRACNLVTCSPGWICAYVDASAD